MPKGKRIGILGGTFNPVHLGHLNLAHDAVKKLKLDKVFFVPTYIPPHKKITDHINPRDRVAMVRAAIKGKRLYALSRFEITKREKSYSIITIRHFRKRFGPRAELFFIIGSDSLDGISQWKDIGNALKFAEFVVCNRPGYSMRRCPKGIRKITIKESDVSSSKIRNLIKKNKSIKTLVPQGVYEYIKCKGMYRNACRGHLLG